MDHWRGYSCSTRSQRPLLCVDRRLWPVTHRLRFVAWLDYNISMRLFCYISVCMAFSLASPGCTSRSRAPIDIQLGMARDQAISALRTRDYCRGNIPVRNTETYDSCHRPGAHESESWIVVRYKKGYLHQLQRFERYANPTKATKRWHELVTARRERSGPPSQEARTRLLEVRGLPSGTVSRAAWFSQDSRVLVGVYRVRKGEDSEPDIVEELRFDVAAVGP